MFDRGDEVLNALPRQEVLLGLRFELGSIIGDNGVWEAMPSYEVFLGKLLHLVGCDFS